VTSECMLLSPLFDVRLCAAISFVYMRRVCAIVDVAKILLLITVLTGFICIHTQFSH